MTLAERKHGDYLQFHTDNRHNGYIMTLRNYVICMCGAIK